MRFEVVMINLVKLVALMIITVFIAHLFTDYIVNKKRIIELISRPFKPITKIFKISEYGYLGLVMSIIHFRSSHVTYATLLKNKVLTERDVIVFTLIQEPLSKVTIISRFLLPLVFSILPPTLAFKLITIIYLESISLFLVGSLYAFMTSKKISHHIDVSDEVKLLGDKTQLEVVGLKGRILKSLKFTLSVCWRIVITLTIISLMINFGLLELIAQFLKNVLTGIDSSIVIIATTHTFSLIAGICLAGEMLRNGVIDEWSAFLGLILGRLPHIGFYTQFINELPFLYGLYGLRLSMKIILLRVLGLLVMYIPLITTLLLVFS